MTNKSSSRLALKLLLPLGAAIIFLIVSVIVTYSQVNVVRREIRTLQQEKVVVMELAQDIRFNVLHTSEIFTDMSAVKDLEGMEEAAEIKAELEASVKELVQILPNEKDNWDHILEEYNVFYDTCNRMKDAYINKGQDAGNELMEEVDPITEKLSTEVDEYSEKVSSELEEYIAEIEDNANTIVLIFIFTSLIVFALIIATTVIVFVQVIKPIISVTKSINELAVQNLATEELNIKNKDEIGDLANSNNKLLNSMRDIVKELNSSADVMDRLSGEMKNNADIVTGSMTDIAEAVGGIATNASDQASDIERTMEEIQSLQNIIATNETTSENLALASKEIAKASTEGSEVIEDLYSVTKESEVAFSAVFDSIQKIIESTQHIKQASNMIESIATQTNLLSLNASIEAARAGDMGKGFAVVADEIRTLSDGSRASVEEINKMLIELEQNVDNAGEQSESIKLAVEKQVAGVETTREKYSNIANSLSTINDEISSLGDISKSLAHSCKIVGEIMNSLASSAEENAASTEETNASVEEVLAMMHGIEENSLNIREISEKLQGQVALYKL